MRDGKVDAGMEGDYARWFREHPFSRYTDPTELIPEREEQSSRGEGGDDEGG